ncbi:MAG: PQQ-binding-like beta-propeller repeat protein [Thermodesulfobacteriota bacterium]
MDFSKILFVGIRSHVLALDRRSGNEIWTTKLERGPWSFDCFVNVLFDRDSVFAETGGMLYCLDPETGRIKWKNRLTGCGYGIASLATANSSAGNAALVNHEGTLTTTLL